MIDFKQCDLARKKTQTSTSDFEINNEFEAISVIDQINASNEVDKLLIEHDMPFDIGLNIMIEKFSIIANKFNISPATLFCIYKENKKNLVNDVLDDAYSRSQETYNGKEKPVVQDDLLEEKTK